MAKTLKIWHRQPDKPLKESPRNYEYFEFFLNLPPLDRTSIQVAKHFRVSERYVNDLRAKKKWNERATARDHFLAETLDKNAENKLVSLQDTWLEWEKQNLADTQKMAEKLKAKCFEMLDLPLTETTEHITELSADGKTVHITKTTKPLKVAASDIPKFAEAAIIVSQFVSEQMQNANRGNTTNIHLPKPSKPIEQMTADERDEFINKLLAAKKALETGETLDLTETMQ